MDDKFSKLKALLKMPLDAMQASDDYFKKTVQDSDLFKGEVARAQQMYGIPEEEAKAKVQQQLDWGGSAGSMIGSIANVGSKVLGSPQAMGLARARAKMAPPNMAAQRGIAEKLSKVEEVPVKLLDGTVANPAVAKNLNPYKASMPADPALMGKSPQDAFKGLLEQAKGDPELLQKILARIKR